MASASEVPASRTALQKAPSPCSDETILDFQVRKITRKLTTMMTTTATTTTTTITITVTTSATKTLESATTTAQTAEAAAAAAAAPRRLNTPGLFALLPAAEDGEDRTLVSLCPKARPALAALSCTAAAELCCFCCCCLL